MEEYIWHINLFVFVLLTVCYLYQFVYVLVVLFKKDNTPQQPAVLHRFGVVIAARNERVVLPNLIRSIQEQWSMSAAIRSRSAKDTRWILRSTALRRITEINITMPFWCLMRTICWMNTTSRR